MSSESSIVIAGAAGFTNLGDDAILVAMLAELREAFPQATFTVAGGPYPVATDPRLEWIQVRDMRAVDAAVARADLLIVGGGGFVYDYDAIISPYDFLRGDIIMFPYYRAALAARTRDVPVYFYGIGVDSLVTPAGRALTRDIVSMASAITVRDPISLLELRRAGVRAPLVEVTADPAVRLPSPASDRHEPTEGSVVAFVTRPWLRWAGTWTPSARQFYETYVNWLAAAADRVVREWDGTPVFLPGQRYNDDDLFTASSVIARMEASDRARILSEVVDQEQYLSTLGSVSAVVSTRLHPLILAGAMGVPVVGIAVSEKVRGFLEPMGLGGQIVSPWVTSQRLVAEAIDRALGDSEPIRRRLGEGMARLRLAAARNPEIARELLSGEDAV